MARSVHVFVRGAVPQFYEWIETLRTIPSLPPLWICGDCHLGNLGPLADADGRVDVQIRDLDQTVIGNPAHDLLRLGLSLSSAARSSVLPGTATSAMVDSLVSGYRAGLFAGDQPREPWAVHTVMRQALGRRWRDLADDRMNGRDRLPRGKRFWDLTDRERHAVDALFNRPAILQQAMALASPGIKELRVGDAAYWRKGCSSLGSLRLAVVLKLDRGKSGPLRAVVDVKQAMPPVAPIGGTMPNDNAERVVEGARALAPNLGDRMIPAHLLGRSVVLRELKPQDLKIEVEQFSSRQASRSAEYLGYVVGRAHGRQIDRDGRRELARAFSARREEGAPPWFWEAMVELAGKSEAAYLRHCRRIEGAA